MLLGAPDQCAKKHLWLFQLNKLMSLETSIKPETQGGGGEGGALEDPNGLTLQVREKCERLCWYEHINFHWVRKIRFVEVDENDGIAVGRWDVEMYGIISDKDEGWWLVPSDEVWWLWGEWVSECDRQIMIPPICSLVTPNTSIYHPTSPP